MSYRSIWSIAVLFNELFYRINILIISLLWLTFLSLSLANAQSIEQTFDGITFIKVEGKTFAFGSPQEELLRRDNEQPRVVSLSHTFWISKYEISQGEWMNTMGVNPSSFKSLGPDLSAPVETVTWYQAKAFVTRMNELAGDNHYRLPTEAEWEYVAKADTTSSWSFGDHIPSLADYSHRDGQAKPRYRGLKLPNQWGIYDLYGNVYEWCEDWYQARRPDSAGGCPPESGTYKVIRGGSNLASPEWLRSSSRNFAHPSRKGYYIGVRLVRVDDPDLDPYQPDTYCDDSDDGTSDLLDEEALPGLTIVERDPNIPAYDRDDWSHWIDEDGDCVNTRHEVLLTESLLPVTMVDGDSCRVEMGQWYDPYTDLTFTVAADLDVDHMVPLANAHASGAWRWNDAERRAYANDQVDEHHLIAVQAAANRSKGSRGPEDWLPPNVAHYCDYARHWILIKARWGLSATQEEWLTLLGMLDTCPEGRPSITDPPDIDENHVPPPSPPHPGDAVNCSDFDHYDDAYAWYIQYFDEFGDIAQLDADGDGVPCASLPGAP